MQPNINDPRYIDWLVRLAEANQGQGVIEEPRLFWDSVTLRDEDPLLTDFTGEVFQNGEQFPVRLTHMVLAPLPTWSPQVSFFTDERLAQNVGVRLRRYDAFYMNQNLLPAPVWINKVLAASDPVSLGSVHWTLDRPVILSARDTLKIDVQAETNGIALNAGAYTVAAIVTGVGLLSKRPYLFGSSLSITTGAKGTFSPTDFKNDGTEPVAITDIGWLANGGAQSASAAGDMRRWRFQVQQVGNGTLRPWFIGPVADGVLAPASLLGISQGRSIVHRFPGDGLLWEPGEGLAAQAAALVAGTRGMTYRLGLAGYITIR